MLGEMAVGWYFELAGLGEGCPFRGQARVVPGCMHCRGQPMTLKIAPKAASDPENLFRNPDMTCTLKKISMTEKESRNKSSDAEQF